MPVTEPRHNRVRAAMDDGSWVTADVLRASQNPDQEGWLLLCYQDLVWWAEPSEYRELKEAPDA